MPIKAQSDLPARTILESENIFLIDETRAISQDIRPLEIAILNLMPLKEETETLQENMVVALEPGLYVQGEFGIRIENNYVITSNGARRLGDLSLEIGSYVLAFDKKY